MGGFLRFLLFATLLVALLVLVVVPAVASPLLVQLIRDQGLQADRLEVSIDTFDPSLLTGRAQKLHVLATSVALGPATVQQLDLTLGDVSFFERSFGTVRGELGGVVVSAGGLQLSVSSVLVNGPAAAAQAAGHMTAAESEQLVRAAAGRAGLQLDDVRFRQGGLRITALGQQMGARVAVHGGALVLEPEIGPAVLLLQPAPADPWRLTEAYVSPDGLTINGVVDATRLTDQLPGVP